MKINKKITLILAAVVLVLSLAACSKTPASTPAEPELPQVEVPKPEVDVVEPVKPDLGVDADEEEPEADYDPIDEMIDLSDHIAKIKLITKGQDKTELKVLDSIKGNISSKDLPAMDTLELNRAYVVFLRNVDGNVILTDEANGVVLLEGDNHELFEKINKKVHNN